MNSHLFHIGLRCAACNMPLRYEVVKTEEDQSGSLLAVKPCAACNPAAQVRSIFEKAVAAVEKEIEVAK